MICSICSKIQALLLWHDKKVSARNALRKKRPHKAVEASMAPPTRTSLRPLHVIVERSFHSEARAGDKVIDRTSFTTQTRLKIVWNKRRNFLENLKKLFSDYFSDSLSFKANFS